MSTEKKLKEEKKEKKKKAVMSFIVGFMFNPYAFNNLFLNIANFFMTFSFYILMLKI